MTSCPPGRAQTDSSERCGGLVEGERERPRRVLRPAAVRAVPLAERPQARAVHGQQEPTSGAPPVQRLHPDQAVDALGQHALQPRRIHAAQRLLQCVECGRTGGPAPRMSARVRPSAPESRSIPLKRFRLLLCPTNMSVPSSSSVSSGNRAVPDFRPSSTRANHAPSSGKKWPSVSASAFVRPGAAGRGFFGRPRKRGGFSRGCAARPATPSSPTVSAASASGTLSSRPRRPSPGQAERTRPGSCPPPWRSAGAPHA